MNKRIYLAEDTPEDILLATAILQNQGAVTVMQFGDGIQLYRAVTKDPPDLVVLDIILPGLSGLAVARLLKFDRRFEDLPVVIASSVMDTDVVERARVAGADAFLRKPYDPTELRSAVARLLA